MTNPKPWTPRFYQIEAMNAFLQALNELEDPVIAMPTGTGKSGVIALICEALLKLFPGMRIVVATHVKELVKQDANAMLKVWKQAPIGIFSAGLKQKQAEMPITFCSIQSAAKAAARFGKVHLVLIDEAQALSPKEESNYQKFLAALRLFNPKLRVGGLTATPYRRKMGMIVDDGLFSKICYDITGLYAFNKMIEWGYLAPLLAKPTSFVFDVSQVRQTGGDFNQKELHNVVDREDKTEIALQEALQVLHDRNHIIVFGSGIDHVTNITNMLRSWGENAVMVHSKLPEHERDANIEAFTAGGANGARWIVNDGVLTTGFDSPWVDGIVDLAPTTSPGLHVQKYGRGTRPYFCDAEGNSLEDLFDLNTNEGRIAAIKASPKHNCRVLDFAGNIARLGPINDPKIPNPKKGKKTGELIMKICPECGAYNFAAARFCCNTEEDCEHEFQFDSKLEITAGTEEVIRKTNAPAPAEMHWFPVDRVVYDRLVRPFQKPEMKVYYHCGLRRFSELVSIESGGWAEKKAKAWWNARLPGYDPPPTTEDGLTATALLKEPTHIYVHTNATWPRVINYSFDGTTPTVELAKPSHLKDQTNGADS